MKTTPFLAPPLAALVLGLLAAACGSPATDPLVGTYVLDVDRTLAAGGLGKPADEALHALRVDFSPEAYRFVILADGTFTLTVATGGEPFVMQGTWQRTPAGVDLATTTVSGQPVGRAEDGAGPLSLPCRVDGESLVLAADGREIFLRRG